MTSKDLNIKLVTALPEISELYNDTVSWQEGDDTGSHIVFEDVLVPYITMCFKKQNKEGLQRSFDVIEEILWCNDEYAEEVIALSVLESFLFKENIEKEIYPFMGERTKKLFETVRRGWNM